MVVSNLVAMAQVETVPVVHSIYTFLKRMEVKGLIERYHDAVLPISRSEVAGFLAALEKRQGSLTNAERDYLADVLAEFRFDLTGNTDGFLSVIDSDEPSFGAAVGEELSDREKYLYAYHDSTLSFFVNGLVTVDSRRIRGDALGNEGTTFLQFGGRLRGTVSGRLGYYAQGTNAQFWGSRELLQRDPVISQSYALGTLDSKNFDFTEGYVRYEGGVVSAQIGRERLLWGHGYDEKMTLSDNIRVFDFIRADASYKSLKYTFLHGWLLGKKSFVEFSLPSDTSATFYEPVVADKYFAAHRLEFSFPGLFDIGGQEMVVYSNRSPDLAYLNPLAVIESAQRSREERDNVFWAFDLQTHFLAGLELSGTLLLDDIHFSKAFSNAWVNRYAIQAGVFVTDPFVPANTSLMVEYVRVEPFVFSHNRSRDNDFGSLGRVLGPRIGPNADSWFFRGDYFPTRNLSFSLRVTLARQGKNVLDGQGVLIKNVGGDILQPHRASDPEEKKFLDGILMKTRRMELFVTYQFINQMWLDGIYQFEHTRNTTAGTEERNHTMAVRLRAEL